MKYNDKTIPIECSECFNHTEEGIQNMIAHIKSEHPQYNKEVVEIYAAKWMESAYAREGEALASYYDDRKLEKSIEADRDFQTHKI